MNLPLALRFALTGLLFVFVACMAGITTTGSRIGQRTAFGLLTAGAVMALAGALAFIWGTP